MAAYKRTAHPARFQRASDGAFVPTGEPTGDSAALDAWLAPGNVPDPADPPPTDPADRTFAGGQTWKG